MKDETYCIDMGGGKPSVSISKGISNTLTTGDSHAILRYSEEEKPVPEKKKVVSGFDAYNQELTGETSMTIASCMASYGPCVLERKNPIGCDIYNGLLTGDVACTETASQGSAGNSGPSVLEEVVISNPGGNNRYGVSRAEAETRTPSSIDEIEVPPGEKVSIGVDIYGRTITGDVACTQTATQGVSTHSGPKVLDVFVADESNITSPTNRSNPKAGDPAPTLHSDCNRTILFRNLQFGGFVESESASPRTATDSKNVNLDIVYERTEKENMENKEKQTAFAMQRIGEYSEQETSSTLKERDHKDATDLIMSVHATQTPITANELSPALNAQGQIGIMEKGIDMYNGNVTGDKSMTMSADTSGDPHHVPCVKTSQLRRLTPLECTRLQGFPDGWCDIGEWTDTKGKTHKDTDGPKYKALGNSIALPFWKWMAKRMAKYLPEDATMASLFDGLGGFPIAFSEAGVKPVWASEIEEYPIAVTKKHFPEEE